MDTLVGNFYIIDNKLFNTSEVNFQFNNSGYLVYEVVRTKVGVILFLEEHLKRTLNSIVKLDLEKIYDEQKLFENLQLLLNSNSYREGNIKFLCKLSFEKMVYAAYYIPHFYPTEDVYKNGVKLTIYNIERNEPGIKQVSVNENIINKIQDSLKNAEAFEVLLVNKQGIITEGSKSNFFLIRDNSIFSSPSEFILEGITRRKVLEIAKALGIENIISCIKPSELHDYEAAFICGTSPKVMPVKSIDGIEFNVENKILQSLKTNFDLLVEDYYNVALNKRGKV
jgi:branched-chain amino acid aminotransferase